MFVTLTLPKDGTIVVNSNHVASIGMALDLFGPTTTEKEETVIRLINGEVHRVTETVIEAKDKLEGKY